MAYSPSEKYPGAVDVDPDYQGGKFRDNNPSTTNNGSPLKAIDRNELLARDEAIMNDAGFEYSGVADTPQDSQLFAAYKASLGNGANLLSNHNFLIQTPDDSQPLPSATPTSYPPGYQIFSGVFANETTGITNLTYIDGRVSFSGGDLYFAVPNTGGVERLTAAQLAASVADFDGKPRTRGVSYALVGDEYRVTVGVDALDDGSGNATPLGSVKFEQGSVATGHDVQTAKGQTYTFNSVAEMVARGAPVGSVCKTKWNNSLSKRGGASYEILTLANYIDRTGNVAPDGFGDHYLNGGTDYVAMLQVTESTTVDSFGAIVDDNAHSNVPEIEAALSSISIARLGFGTYYVDGTINVTSAQKIVGKGRRGLSVIRSTGDTYDCISLASNARGWELSGFDIEGDLQSTYAGIKSPQGTLGAAEGLIKDINISVRFDFGILGYDTFWNNRISDMRIGSKNSIHVLGTNGTSISNTFENIYCDVTGAVLPAVIKLQATKNFIFIGCNFGGTTDAGGGLFVGTGSSNNGLRFISCNFEVMFVANQSSAFNHTDASEVTYSDCTFIRMDGNGTSSGSTVIRSDSASAVSLINCGFGQSTPTTEFNINTLGAKVALFNSPAFDDQSRIRYQTYSGFVPDYIFDAASMDRSVNRLEKVAVEQSTISDTLGATQTNTYDFDTGVSSTVDTVTFAYDTPTTSSQAATLAGQVTASLAGRNVAGVRTTSYARWDVYFNNEGNALITRNQSLTDGTAGNRTAEMAMTLVADKLQITITPNSNNVTGKLTVTADFNKVRNETSVDIDFAM